MNARLRRPLIVALVAAAVGVGIWQWQKRADAGRDTSRIAANGTIEADEVEIGSQRAARLAQFRVEEGRPVKRGDVVAVLDTSELRAQLDQARGGVLMASARLRELLRGTRSEEVRRAAAQVDQAQANVGGAQRSLGNARKGLSRRTQLKQALDAATAERNVALAALDQAQASLSGSQEAVRTAEREFETTIQLRQTRDTARQTLEAAQAQQRNAHARLAQLLNGERPEVIAAAQAQVGQAAEALQQAREEAENANTELRRTRELHAGGAAADRDLETATTRAETSEARLKQAEQARLQALARLTEVRNGARPEEIVQARATVAQAQANVEGGQKALQNAEQALELRLGARGSLDAARTQRSVAEAQLASARSGLSGAELAVRNARIAYGDALGEKQTVDTALTQYQTGIAQLRAAEAQLAQLRTGATREEIDQVRGQLQQARGQLELAQVQYRQSIIRAPRDGVITEHVAEVGEVVSPGASVARLVPLDDVYLTLYVPLPELGRVKVGQKVDVTADTYRGKVYPGAVERISDTPEFTPRNVQTQDERVKLVFQVRVRVKNPDRELKPGMPADATIRLAGGRQ